MLGRSSIIFESLLLQFSRYQILTLPTTKLTQYQYQITLTSSNPSLNDGNLENSAYCFCSVEEFHNPESTMEDDSTENQTSLRTAPSFSIYNANDGFGEENDPEEVLNRTLTVGVSKEAMGSGEFSFGKNRMDLIEEEMENEKESSIGMQNSNVGEEIEPASPPMYLATGLGVEATGFGGLRFDKIVSDDLSMLSMPEGVDAEEFYTRMIDKYPCHPLLLRNYAQILQSKGDLHGAEDYLLRATLADPHDGEILMQYAKLVWELHHDKDRVLSYLERATQAAPQDSHVLAAYASFLWETEDDDKESGKNDSDSENDEQEKKIELVKLSKEENEPVSAFSQHAAGQEMDRMDLVADNFGEDGNLEDYYKKMIDEKPDNTLFLKDYAQFLVQSKGDLQGAEEYYLQATVADPANGEILIQYAKLAWELHHDKDRALSYFEHAAQAAPQDSHVLAAYASFLWEIDEDDEGGRSELNSKNDEEEKKTKYVEPSKEESELISPFSHIAAGQEIDAVDVLEDNWGKDGNDEDYYKKMIDEDPGNPSVLKRFAQFLFQSKGDLQAAEKYYLRAILANPSDGETISEYAKLVWELHHDQGKALTYFEQAIQAAPGNCHVLAAYACFLWETEDGEGEVPCQNHVEVRLLLENTMVTA